MEKFKLILAIFCGVVSLGNTAFSSEKKSVWSKFSSDFSVEHYTSADRDADDSSYLFLGLGLKINKNHSLRLDGAFTKLYIVDPNQDELQVDDAALSYRYKVSQKPLGLSLSAKTSFLIPLSERSIRNDLLTRVTERFYITKKFFKDRLILSYRPSGSYYFNEYKVTRGGTPLTKWKLGHSALLSYRPIPSAGITFIAGSTITQKEKILYQADSGQTNGGYSFNLYTDFQIFKDRLYGRLGMSQSGSQLNGGFRDISLYDDEGTNYYAALDIVLF